MGKKKVFIDGSSGTTGLRINERFQGRDDIEIMQISEDKRKDPVEKAKLKLDDVHNVLKTVIKIYLKLHPEATFEEVETALMKDVDPTISKYQELFKDDALNKLYYNAIDEIGISKTR